MHVERLLRLAALLEADAANPNGVKFDLGTWAKDGRNTSVFHDSEFKYIEGQTVPVNCGTKACAIGLAVISGTFKDEGLTYEISSDGMLSPITSFKDGYGNPYFGFDAVKQFFDIDYNTADQLFTEGRYEEGSTGADAELAVAKRIRQLVANGSL